jgi:hypothetical protein
MRFSATALALLTAGASAYSIFRGDEQSIIIKDDELDVPGQSPLRFCGTDRSNDIITIETVVLTPNPPQA